jgi:hypothetical protein
VASWPAISRRGLACRAVTRISRAPMTFSCRYGAAAAGWQDAGRRQAAVESERRAGRRAPSAAGMRLLILGGSGFVGRTVADEAVPSTVRRQPPAVRVSRLPPADNGQPSADLRRVGRVRRSAVVGWGGSTAVWRRALRSAPTGPLVVERTSGWLKQWAALRIGVIGGGRWPVADRGSDSDEGLRTAEM